MAEIVVTGAIVAWLAVEFFRLAAERIVKFPDRSSPLELPGGGVERAFQQFLRRIIPAVFHDYRWLFLFGGAITLTAFLLLIKVYRDYLRFGGDKAYEPPLPE